MYDDWLLTRHELDSGCCSCEQRLLTHSCNSSICGDASALLMKLHLKLSGLKSRMKCRKQLCMASSGVVSCWVHVQLLEKIWLAPCDHILLGVFFVLFCRHQKYDFCR